MQRNILTLLFVLIISTVSGQNNSKKPSEDANKNNGYAFEKVYKNTRIDFLKGLAVNYSAQYNKDRELIKTRAFAKGWNIKSADTCLEGFELKGFTSNGFAVYYFTSNNGVNGGAGTSSTNALWPHRSLGLNLTGENMKIGEWDEGAIRSTHIEITGRVTQADGNTSISSHSTHVAGTLIADRY